MARGLKRIGLFFKSHWKRSSCKNSDPIYVTFFFYFPCYIVLLKVDQYYEIYFSGVILNISSKVCSITKKIMKLVTWTISMPSCTLGMGRSGRWWPLNSHREMHPVTLGQLEPLEGYLGPLDSHLAPLDDHFWPLVGHLKPQNGHLGLQNDHSHLLNCYIGLLRPSWALK